MNDEPIYHLLKPKEHKIWCTGRSPSYRMNITRFASKANCANCLGMMRGKHFKVSWTNRRNSEFSDAYKPELDSLS